MRKFGLMVGLALFAIACATGADMVGEMMDSGVPDAGAQPGTGEGMKLVGNSTQTVTPSEGLFGIYAACQQTFGAGHRMCTLAEILNTADMPTLAAGLSIYQSNLGVLECGGWSQTRTGTSPNVRSLYAPAVDESGKFDQAYCGEAFAVACCGPK
jgi:hypothetical protein